MSSRRIAKAAYLSGMVGWVGFMTYGIYHDLPHRSTGCIIEKICFTCITAPFWPIIVPILVINDTVRMRRLYRYRASDY